MDPLSALSVSAAVVQFADFGYRVLKGVHQIYGSPLGQTPGTIELSLVSHELSQLADHVEAKLNGANGLPEETFRRLCAECREVNGELQGILGKLQARGQNKVALAVDSWRVMLRQVAAASDIEKLVDRMGRIRQQIMVVLLSLMLGEAQKNGVELRQFAKQQADMVAALDRIGESTKKLSADVVDLIDTRPSDHGFDADEMVRYVLSNKWNASEHLRPTGTLVDEHRDQGNLGRIYQSLFFRSMGHREEGIPKKHAATFEWVFQQPRVAGDGRPLWSSFPDWLEGDSSDVYWITGKPGAGKSTLVKLIARDPRLVSHLRVWADRSPLVMARFFSWTAGADELQKSQIGLLRALLLEALQQRAQLVAEILPARWFLLQSFHDKVKLPALTMGELMVAFEKLLSVTGEKLKLFLIIDGLDEFDEDHRQLVQQLREANARAGVKICASSRPWNVFRDEYRTQAMLQLEDLTRDDIILFVQNRLESSPGYQDFTYTNPQAARKIITDIIKKSQGVFLWVSVILGMLETSFQEGSRITELQATIDQLPSEVSDLFRYIWDRTSRQFREEASQYFQVITACRRLEMNLYALILWFGEKDFSVDAVAARDKTTYVTGILKSLERTLMSRTGGLLEVIGAPYDPEITRVDFMHRTANDWVKDNWASIVAATDIKFNPFLWIVKGCVLRATHFLGETKLTMGLILGLDLRELSIAASLVPDDSPDWGILAALLDDFDMSATGLALCGTSTHWSSSVKFPGSDPSWDDVIQKMTKSWDFTGGSYPDLLGLAA